LGRLEVVDDVVRLEKGNGFLEALIEFCEYFGGVGGSGFKLQVLSLHYPESKIHATKSDSRGQPAL
jgi:hypothetical protein